MAFQFPQNRDILDVQTNSFSRTWLQFFNQLYKRLAGVDAVTAISTADVASAGATYNQTYIQTLASASNEHKAKINEILETLKK
jgi:hypothetical protein